MDPSEWQKCRQSWIFDNSLSESTSYKRFLSLPEFCHISRYTDWEMLHFLLWQSSQQLRAVFGSSNSINNHNCQACCRVLYTYTHEGLSAHVSRHVSYSCRLFRTRNCLQICWCADLLWFIFALLSFLYFWLILVFASKSLVSLWLKYRVYDLRKGNLELWGIVQPDKSTNTISQIQKLGISNTWSFLKLQVVAWKWHVFRYHCDWFHVCSLLYS